MKFNIRGSKDILDESVKNYIETKIGKLDKYFENPDEITANILVKESGIKETIDWYLNNTEWIDNILSGEYKEAYKD